MPPRRPPYLHRQQTRHGNFVWYVRVGHGRRIRINETFGTPEFDAAYLAARQGEHSAPKPKVDSASLEWLIKEYRKSPAWSRLSPATKYQRENILRHVIQEAGRVPFGGIEQKQIESGIARRASTPFAANNFLKTMRHLFQWAVKTGKRKKDPTAGVVVDKPRTDGFHAWSEKEIEKYETRWPIGTRERLWLAVLLYTGLRRGDATRLGPQHVEDGVISIVAEKTGTEIVIPMLPALAQIIEASPIGEETFIATIAGKPYRKESFGNQFKDACKAAGVPGSAHGLRKAGATRAAENGATEAQLEAIYGWHGGKQAAVYTRKANRRLLARDAMGKLNKKE